ncbi:MAG: GNAT family N-acetyltransferase [Bacilli bacterium]|nr:GNAT family N-acetyltransferase [Bacilli bacterium]MBN2696315.1 GNAT family N-acetyltransferase [Bacilli bacterium]
METQRLILRPFHILDLNDLYDYLSKPEVTRYEPYEPFTWETCKKEIKARSKSADYLAVYEKQFKKVIGNVYFHNRDNLTWELGYIFNSDFWRKGYAFEAVSAFIEFAFYNLRIHRIIARCDTRNDASWRLLEKLGFRREGHEEKNIAFRKDSEGKALWQDTYQYARLLEEHLAKS